MERPQRGAEIRANPEPEKRTSCISLARFAKLHRRRDRGRCGWLVQDSPAPRAEWRTRSRRSSTRPPSRTRHLFVCCARLADECPTAVSQGEHESQASAEEHHP